MMDREKEARLRKILNEVGLEVIRASAKHARLNSPHEGYAVLQEEVDELWDEVKRDRGLHAEARTEAIQCAAMAIRYILDLAPDEVPF